MKFIRLVWKLFIMASVFGIGYIIGREHSFEEEEMWEEEENKAEAESENQSASSEGDIEVDFEFEDADAEKVAIVGNFNNWDKDATPLTKDGNVWKCTLKLKPGKYEYQFVVNDTDWVVDPKSGNNVKNKYEGTNSIIEIS